MDNENVKEFDINEYVMETLKPLPIPVYFVARKEVPLPFVLFSVTGEKGNDYWDNEERIVKYSIALNIFSTGNFIEIKKQIMQLMKDAGFFRYDVPQAIYQEDIGIFNQPMSFNFYKEF